MITIPLETASTLFIAGFIGLLILAWYQCVVPSLDPHEPPLAPYTIPYLSHVLGLYKRSFNYYVDLNEKAPLSISTLHIPGQKVYVVNSPQLIQTVQKQPKVLSLRPIEAKISGAVCGLSQKARDLMMKNVKGTDDNWGISADMYPLFEELLKPGEGLDALNNVMIRVVGDALDSLAESMTAKSEKKTMSLNAWCREVISEATTDSLYGPANPFREPRIQEAFWEFEKHFMFILLGFMRSLFARKGLAARDKVAQSFYDYFKPEGHKRGSSLPQQHFDLYTRHDTDVIDIARLEVGMGIAFLDNTAPATFWLLTFLYSNPEFLEEVRKELDCVVQISTDSEGQVMRNLDITTVSTNCPHLTSAFQETLRLVSMGTASRMKDAMVQMPSRVVHVSTDIWGSDAADFNPYRFFKGSVSKNPSGKRPPGIAFRAFGGGATSCPGRHFATNEVLALVSMFVSRFEIEPTKGIWKIPRTDNTRVQTVIMEPDDDIEVSIFARGNLEVVKWKFGLQDSTSFLAMANEDKLSP
ncbi:hypothetical protein HYFRA_00007681 [Hymenoscyphus fraxineus]|uniref:Cytochrome P450 n=1 Tax=Hymenoscyphus fraxineus TaxID=746836 RepID=A0A9N9KVN6_9HELO|nr:hypothetical protein HYFRA_00007681 [Hymenoscyphus fraxineus]